MNIKNVGKAEDMPDDKIQTTIYLSVKTLERIDDMLFYIRKRLPIEKRRKLSKSVVCEICFGLVIDDYNLKGEDSGFWQVIQKFVSDKLI